MNNENLIKKEDRTPEERRKNARKAGIASGKARRRKRNLKNVAESLLSMNIPVEMESLRKGLEAVGVEEKDMCYDMAIVVAMFQKAVKGNVRAAEWIRDLVGQHADHELKEKEFAYKKKQDREEAQKAEIKDNHIHITLDYGDEENGA